MACFLAALGKYPLRNIVLHGGDAHIHTMHNLVPYIRAATHEVTEKDIGTKTYFQGEV